MNNGNGTFGSPIGYAGDSLFVVTADLNEDDYLDLVEAYWDGGFAVMLNFGNGTFQPPTNYGTINNPSSLALGDFNGDGHTDLAVTSNYDNDVVVLLNNGNGTFGPGSTYATANNPVWVAAGDFNGDGHGCASHLPGGREAADQL